VSCKYSANLISNLCRLSESQKIVEGFRDYTPLLLEILKDDKTEREIRVPVIDALIETFGMTKKLFSDFFPVMLNQLIQTANWSVEVNNRLDNELFFF